ncbi:RagB/SusD family nutrient uptake outer membrane protein [Fulvivirga maritima]|uniref:RagB/SusD family nutrient uptake outer membrane protein n=1 Tax=Fulvivirga maritima TaxID=2904247 RepID=UPI001F46F99A|nr:RagB/SusD family nutrient uptake outer membrane protein [Fulvivirga maritima]UII28824.1 RagB/SusD family nutrient uptake outer membrane protein [Fulvivirga maritima]
MNIKNYIYISLLSGILFACSDDFLESEPTEYISSDRLEKLGEIDANAIRASLKGIYSLMSTPGAGGTAPSTDPGDYDHDDFGQKGIDIYTDLLSSDMVLESKTYGWYSNVSDLQSTTDYTSPNSSIVWTYYFKIINSANNVIDILGGTDATPETEESKVFMAQAKAMRAYAYFYLANLLTTDYIPTDEILPIYTGVSDSNKPLSTTAAVYTLIEEDLLTAISYLENYSRDYKYEIDANVAKGLLAYTYAAQGENEKVAEITEEIINQSPFSILEKEEVTTNGFNDVSSSNWMWGLNIDLNMSLDLVSWWGQVDIYTYSYASVGDGKVINNDLYETIPASDSRKGQFIEYPDSLIRQGNYFPANKFFAPAKQLQGQRNIETDYVYMRIEEMYLLNAEANAKLGRDTEAQFALRSLLEERTDDTSYISSLTGQELIDETILQTRIELWGEGKSYLSMKRNKLTIELGSNHLTYPNLEINYNDDRLSFEIPQSEIQNNPFIN